MDPHIRPHFQGYAAALNMRPEWVTGFLVFQGGNANVRPASLTGGGQIYGHEYQGLFQPLVYPNAPGIGSMVGGGQIVGFPPSLAALYGGSQGTGS